MCALYVMCLGGGGMCVREWLHQYAGVWLCTHMRVCTCGDGRDWASGFGAI